MDRLSELPDSLILHIFGFLPMNDVVRTMVLSKQWKTLWSTTTRLTFDEREMVMGCGSISTERFRNFVYRALVSWKGSKMVKFAVIFHSSLHDIDIVGINNYKNDIRDDIDLWVGFAVGRGVEHLHVELQNPCSWYHPVVQELMYLPPQCLYSCSSLHQLHLRGCHLEIHGNAPVQWRHLEKLHIGCFGVAQPVIDQVLAGSPKLERFEISSIYEVKSLSIQSSSLRYLRIHNYNIGDDVPQPWMDAELRIWTPNLETLKIHGGYYCKCLMMNVSSLTAAAFRFYIGPYNSGLGYHPDCIQGYIHLLGEMFIQILPTFQHVVQLKLSACCIKAVVGGMEKKYMPPNVKSLKLYVYSFQEYHEIVSLLANFPQLEKLVIQPGKEHPNTISAKTKSLAPNCPLPDSFLLQLSRVKLVTWTDDDDSIFPFIEILLKCASNLQNLVLRVQGISFSSFLSAQRLLRMPRSSPHCTIDFQ